MFGHLEQVPAITTVRIFLISNKNYKRQSGGIQVNKKFRQIRNTIAVILFAFGIGIFILSQVVERNNLIKWQEPITLVLWVYITLVFLYIIFFNAIPLVCNYFKKSKL